MSSNFDDFVKSHVGSQMAVKDYEAIKREWIADISALYMRLEEYLNEQIALGQIAVIREEIRITEQLLGGYNAPALRIVFQGGSSIQIRIYPKGLYVIAARGRIDIDGPRGSAILVRVPKDSDGPQIKTYITVEGEPAPSREAAPEATEEDWKFASRSPRISYHPLTKDSFQEMIMHIVNG